jgi:hypothetical protein
MLKGKILLMVGFFAALTILSFWVGAAEASPHVYHGQVVAQSLM